MGEGGAVVLAAAVGGMTGVASALVAVVADHRLSKRDQRGDITDRAVANLSASVMQVLLVLDAQRVWIGGRRGWLIGMTHPNMTSDALMDSRNRLIDLYGEVVRAHGELVQHAGADLADRAGDVLEAMERLPAAMATGADAAEAEAAQSALGQTRLRFLRAARPRSRNLQAPKLFENIRTEDVTS